MCRVGPETGGDEQTTVQQGRRVLGQSARAVTAVPGAGSADLMLVAGSGSMVNVASVAGLLGVADRSAYQASKHGLIGLTRTLAAEWGGRGVRVNAFCPGWVKTGWTCRPGSRRLHRRRPIDRVPMDRFTTRTTSPPRRLVRRRQLGQPAAAPPLTVGLTNRRCPPSSAARGSTRLGQRAVE